MIRTIREGMAILTSREFWIHFRQFYVDWFAARAKSAQDWEMRKEAEMDREVCIGGWTDSLQHRRDCPVHRALDERLQQGKW